MKIFRITVLSVMLTMGVVGNILAQNGHLSSSQREMMTQKVQQLTDAQRQQYYQKIHARVPSKEILQQRMAKASTTTQKIPQHKSNGVQMPDKFWFPGEFEEVQAILITWSYYHLRSDILPNTIEYVEPITDSLGWGDNDAIVPYLSLIDTFNNSRLPIIQAKLADAIQQGGAEVWINLVNAEDTLVVKKYMRDHNCALTNYRFFINHVNSFWYRDCGPIGFYYSDNDSVAFLDFEYYPGRALDDQISQRIGEQTNTPVYATTLAMEGGNVLLDGTGMLATSDMVYYGNMETTGQVFINAAGDFEYIQKTALTAAQTKDSLMHLFGLDRIKVLPYLHNDGGTGHIDLYASMWDENNFVFTQYPTDMSSQVDYTISAKNVDTLLNMYSFHGQKYRGRNIPLPKKDNSKWYTSSNDFERYTRTYSNSTIVNDVIIQPVFSSSTYGAVAWDEAALQIISQRFPGYKIIPIDIRGEQVNDDGGFDGTGGAIHCITKQIPAQNPVRILHGAIQDYAGDYNGNFNIEAIITNQSGIASATCFWRVKGDTIFNPLIMNNIGGDTFSVLLDRTAYLAAPDTIEYYISATSNNGKTINKPFPAPRGFYTFFHGQGTSQQPEPDVYDLMNTLDAPKFAQPIEFKAGQFYPNPATKTAHIAIEEVENSQLTITVINMYGQTIYQQSVDLEYSDNIFLLNTSSFSSGFYHVVFQTNNGKSCVRKLVVL
ncbi:MAG: agmatine deiminase family protein [Bacteroidales bacterium]|nr:agmatine deiminase family protein [Bacteroidales bacterium]